MPDRQQRAFSSLSVRDASDLLLTSDEHNKEHKSLGRTHTHSVAVPSSLLYFTRSAACVISCETLKKGNLWRPRWWMWQKVFPPSEAPCCCCCSISAVELENKRAKMCNAQRADCIGEGYGGGGGGAGAAAGGGGPVIKCSTCPISVKLLDLFHMPLAR